MFNTFNSVAEPIMEAVKPVLTSIANTFASAVDNSFVARALGDPTAGDGKFEIPAVGLAYNYG